MPLFGGKKKGSPLLEAFTRGRRYRRLGLLGSGGLAQVSSLFDAYLNRIVACKELKRGNADNGDLLRAFITEARLVSYLNHPGVVPVFDSFVNEQGGIGFTMQVVEGRTLGALVCGGEAQDGTPMAVFRCLEIFVKMCETMAFAHDKGVIHLDLKPDNVMIGRWGEVLIMDWGSAFLYDEKPYAEYLGGLWRRGDSILPGEESASLILGTPEFMSPEQTRSPRSTLLPSSDVFSMGVIFYLMLTGLHPFAGGSLNEVIARVREHRPAQPCEVNPSVPRRLSQICMRMLEKEPGQRPSRCREVLTELAEFSDSGQGFATRLYEPGQVIFEEGAPGDYAFIIVNGTVEIAKRHDGVRRVLATLGRNEIVGELAIFTGQPRTATATAIEQTTIRIMGREEVKRELDKLSPWVERMVSGLSYRFIDMNRRLLESGAP